MHHEPFKFPEAGPEHEKANGDLESLSWDNWLRIPEEVRRQVVDHVRAKVPVSMLNTWKDQNSRNMRIGSDDPLFHMFPGMSIRNCCREVLLDQDLPPVDYNGEDCYNWDDFYCGMLRQLAFEAEC